MAAMKSFGLSSARYVVKSAFGHRAREIITFRVLSGVRGGLKFGVDRATLLYTEKN